MSASQTIFVIDPDLLTVSVVRSIAVEMRTPCESFDSAEEFLAAYTGQRAGCLVSEFRLMGLNRQGFAIVLILLP